MNQIYIEDSNLLDIKPKIIFNLKLLKNDTIIEEKSFTVCDSNHFESKNKDTTEENKNNEINTSEQPQQNNEGFFNMDFQPNPSQTQQQNTLDDMLNMNFQPNSQPTNTNLESNMNFNLNNVNPKVDDEEQKRLEAREKEAQEKREKINKKIKKEDKLKNKIKKQTKK